MKVNRNERLKEISKLIEDYGLPLPLYCDNCKSQIGYYFKTGLGRWDGKPSSVYCKACGKEINDSRNKSLS
jgi:predicted Zn-dependent protease